VAGIPGGPSGAAPADDNSQPFMDPETAQQAGQFTTWQFIRGLLILLSGLVLGAWGLWLWLKSSRDDPGRLISKWIISAMLLGFLGFSLIPAIAEGGYGGAFTIPLAAAVLVILGLIWAPNLAGLVAQPLANMFDGGSEVAEVRPCYSAAQTKRNRGKPLEAIAEIRIQLERFPNDYEGHVLLATIQAEDLDDLQGACLTLERTMQFPGQTPGRIVSALNLMADWHMQYGLDPDSARDAFQRIIDLAPDSHSARMAAQRIAHLASRDRMVEAREHSPIALPVRERGPARMNDDAPSSAPDSDAEEEVGELIAQLEQHPLDTAARERLALLYAEHYQRVDLAASELDQLIALAGEPQKNVVRWLNLLCDLWIKHGADLPAAEQTLQRVIDLFPTSAAAESARTRMTTLSFELSANKPGQTVQLGSYEKNLGLKKGRWGGAPE
jgi:tetratricopeptide (TPR) repeat protein